MSRSGSIEEQQLNIERDKLKLEKRRLKEETGTRILTLLAILVSAFAIVQSSCSEKSKNDNELNLRQSVLTDENSKLKSDVVTLKRIELFKKLTEKVSDPETVMQTYKAIFIDEKDALTNVDLNKLRQ